MKHVDAGNVGIYGSAIGGVGTTGMTAAEWITSNGTIIGLSLSLLSLVVGVVIKIMDMRSKRQDDERRHQEALALRVAEEEKTRAALIAEIRKKR